MPRGYDVDPNAPTKLCPACGKNLPWENFYKCKSTMHGYQNRCKRCSYACHNEWRLKNLDKMSKDQKRRREADPERWKDYSRKRYYGLKPGEYDTMLRAQSGECAICGAEDAGGRGSFHVDHCHKTGAIRGLLCHKCNVGLGQFNHSVKLLQIAINYIKGTIRT